MVSWYFLSCTHRFNRHWRPCTVLRVGDVETNKTKSIPLWSLHSIWKGKQRILVSNTWYLQTSKQKVDRALSTSSCFRVATGGLSKKMTCEQIFFLLDKYTWIPFSLPLFTITYGFKDNTPALKFSNLDERQYQKTLKIKRLRYEYFLCLPKSLSPKKVLHVF